MLGRGLETSERRQIAVGLTAEYPVLAVTEGPPHSFVLFSLRKRENNLTAAYESMTGGSSAKKKKAPKDMDISSPINSSNNSPLNKAVN
jgi:hypothetical protein